MKRKLKIEETHEVAVTKSWDRAAIHFKTYENGEVAREALIRIPSPGYLREIREKLDMIEQAWKDMLS